MSCEGLRDEREEGNMNGWIEWGGGRCPVDLNELVQCKVPNGVILKTARYVQWDRPDYIKAYRVWVENND